MRINPGLLGLTIGRKAGIAQLYLPSRPNPGPFRSNVVICSEDLLLYRPGECRLSWRNRFKIY